MKTPEHCLGAGHGGLCRGPATFCPFPGLPPAQQLCLLSTGLQHSPTMGGLISVEHWERHGRGDELQ